MWFSKQLPKKFEEVRVREIRFLGEQDGPYERILKSKLVDIFHRDQSIEKAYLVRVDFGNGKNAGVVLGLRTQLGPDKAVVEKIGAVFASVFNAKQHLDIMFLTDDQEKRISKICKPFFCAQIQ